MSFLLLRSIPMSNESLRAWRSQNVRISPGHSDLEGLEHRILAEEAEGSYMYHGVINLGISSFDPVQPDIARIAPFWWNRGLAIRMTRRPSDLRRTMGRLLAPKPSRYPADVWIKAGGRKGNGKDRLTLKGPIAFLPHGTDMQLHVTGREFRVVTVNHKVIQAFERFGPNDNRAYEWRGLTNTPRVVKELAREGSRQVPGYNMYAWDIALGTTEEHPDIKPYILEANSAPGINEHTARRILQSMLFEWEQAQFGGEGVNELPDEEAG